jgi:hypothetical protein
VSEHHFITSDTLDGRMGIRHQPFGLLERGEVEERCLGGHDGPPSRA